MLNLWSLVLLASVAIGLFLLTLLLFGRKTNPQATYLFSSLLLVLVAVNFDNWIYASGNWTDIPMVVGFSRASILLIGPLVYFYSRSIIFPDFRVRPIHVFHLLPYLAAFAVVFPSLFLYGEEFKREYLRQPMESGTYLDLAVRTYFVAYLVHISAYLTATLRMIHREVKDVGGINFIVPTRERLRWIRTLALVVALCFLALSVPLSWTIISGAYHPEINFVLTAVYSILIFYLGVSFIKQERLVLPDFIKKYQSVSVSEEQALECASKLADLLDNQMIYLDPDLTLGMVADRIGIPAGYLSKHINEVFGKSFPDLINSYRVEELKKRLADPSYDRLTILGLAMEVGFNSKSSFNAAFKKITGLSPSEYKKALNRPA